MFTIATYIYRYINDYILVEYDIDIYIYYNYKQSMNFCRYIIVNYYVFIWFYDYVCMYVYIIYMSVRVSVGCIEITNNPVLI